MRKRPFFLTAAVLLSACADDQHATAPASRSGSRYANGNLAASSQSGVTPQAKPTDQVGFTKVAAAYGIPVNLGANADANATVTCPAGSFPTGGGFAVVVNGVGSMPTVHQSLPTETPAGIPDGWSISASNTQPGAVAALIQAWVMCAS